MSTTDRPSVIAAKRLFRAVLQNDFREALAELRASHPGLSVEDPTQVLRRERPALWQEGQRLDETLAGHGRGCGGRGR